MDTPRPRLSVHSRILVGFVVGAAAGILANQLVSRGVLAESVLEIAIENFTAPLGRIFLNLLFMVVVPIVFCSIALGVSQLGAGEKLGRLTTRTLGFFVVTSGFAALIGLSLVTLLGPGHGFDPEAQSALLLQYGEEADQKRVLAEQERFWPDVIVSIVPRNPLRDAVELNMLPVIFAAIVFGVALARLPEETSVPVNRFLDGVASAMVVIVGFAMRLAPFAVPALIFDVTARFGWGIFAQLSMFVIVVVLGYLLQLFAVNAVLVQTLAATSARKFFSAMTPVMVTALSTSSSSATLPTTIRTAERELGVPSRLAGFVLPLGATLNMNGTAVFVAVVVVFLGQVFGVQLGLQSLATIALFSVLTAVGAAGVPSGSLPIIVVVLIHFGIPGEGLALILGVERILDMGRTVVNVTGDAVAACYVARLERGAEATEDGLIDAAARGS